MLQGKKILLVISGGIAIQKTPALIELLKNDGASITAIMTKNAEEFISPAEVEKLTGHKVHTNTFDKDGWMEHIDLSREADLVLVAPATANLIAKMAHGISDDMASTTLLASNKPIMVCPAMNVEMWNAPSTQKNIETLRGYDIDIIGPAPGLLACGEFGMGRLTEPHDIFKEVQNHFAPKILNGLKVVVTAGPTQEPIDPVRYISNHSSGKQGYAIAKALAAQGADVMLISGPTDLPDPKGLKTIRVTTAAQMLTAAQSTPADIFIAAAAVADWTPENTATQKMKKAASVETMAIQLKQNPDILKTIATSANRPSLVIGFAAETENTVDNARTKQKTKGCDWVVANSVNAANPVFGSNENQVYFVTSDAVEEWPRMDKDDVAKELAARVAAFFNPSAVKTAAE